MTIQGGHGAIVDAVYARPADRQAIERVAADAGVPFVGVWLEAPETTLITRVEQRRDDASDADAAVIRLQHRDGTGTIGWHRVEASRSPGVVLDEALKYVHELAPGAVARNVSS
jgi:predicted kinase